MTSFRVSLQDTDPAQLAVLGFYNTPPAHLAGRRVVVGTAPTGAFNGHANKIAWSDGTNWWFDQPEAGWETWSDADAGHYYFTGSAWVSRAAFVQGLSYWTKSGNDIYYNSGKVGFMTDTPSAPVDMNVSQIKIGKQLKTPQRMVTVGGHINFQVIAPPSTAQLQAISLANAGAGNIPAGTYYYAVTYYGSEGDASGGYGYTLLPSIMLGGSSQVSLTNIPVSTDPRVIGRKIYRSQAGTSGDYYYLYHIGTITNNTATTWTDNTAINTTSGDWWYNKYDQSSGRFYVDGIPYSMLNQYVTAFGANAFGSLTRGSTGAAFGTGAGGSVTTGSSNHAFGHSALAQVTTGSDNIGVGYAAMQWQQTGSGNIAVGSNAVRRNSAGSHNANIGIGTGTLYEISAGSTGNLALGFYAGAYGLQGTVANYNVFLGAYSANKPGDSFTGTGNVFLGAFTGRASGTGNYNIVLGYNVDLPNPNNNYELNLGNVIYAKGLAQGNSPSGSGSVGISTTNPLQKFHVAAGDINLDTNYGIRVNNTAPSGQFLRGNGTRFVASAIQAGDLPAHDHGSAAGWTYDGSNDRIHTGAPDRRVSIGTQYPVRDNTLQVYNSQASLAEVLISTADGSFIEFNNIAVSQYDSITGFRGLLAHTYNFDTKVFPFPNAILAGFNGDLSKGITYAFAELFPNDKEILPGLRIKFAPDGNDSFYRHASLFRETQYNAAFEITNFYPGVMPAMKIFNGVNGEYLQFTHNSSGSVIESNEAIGIIGVGGISFYTGGIIAYVTNAGLGIDVAATEALLHLGAGINTKAPLKFSSGTNLTTPQAGAVEWDGTRLYITNSARQTLAYLKDVGLKSSQTAVINATSNSSYTDLIGTNVGTNQIPANTYQVGDQLQTELSGVFTTGANVQPITIKVVLNSTDLVTLSASLPGGASNWDWSAKLTLTIKTTGASGKALLTGMILAENRSLGYAHFQSLTKTTEVDIDTTAANTLKLQAQWTNTGNSLKSISSKTKLERVN